MSNATTVKQANAEHLADLKKLRPKRDDYLRALKEQAVRFNQLATKLEHKINQAAQSFVDAHKAQVDKHIDDELAAVDDE